MLIHTITSNNAADVGCVLRVKRTNDPYVGRLLIYDNGDLAVDERVRLSYGARFGPDVQDVADWEARFTRYLDVERRSMATIDFKDEPGRVDRVLSPKCRRWFKVRELDRALVEISTVGKSYTPKIPVSFDTFLKCWDAWYGGDAVQRAFPELTAEQREFIMTGTTPEEWAAMFPKGDEE